MAHSIVFIMVYIHMYKFIITSETRNRNFEPIQVCKPKRTHAPAPASTGSCRIPVPPDSILVDFPGSKVHYFGLPRNDHFFKDVSKNLHHHVHADYTPTCLARTGDLKMISYPLQSRALPTELRSVNCFL
jgi:hypothetical protein